MNCFQKSIFHPWKNILQNNLFFKELKIDKLIGVGSARIVLSHNLKVKI